MKFSFTFRCVLYMLIFLSCFLDPGSTLGFRNYCLLFSVPTLFLLSLKPINTSLNIVTACIVSFVLYLVFYSLIFLRLIDYSLAFSYWAIILSFPYFIFVLKKVNPHFRRNLYKYSIILFFIVSFLALAFLVLYPPPFSSSIGPVFFGRTNYPFIKGFVYHGSFLYIFPFLSFCSCNKKSSLLFLLLSSALFFSVICNSLGGIMSSIALFCFLYNNRFNFIVSKYPHYCLPSLITIYFLYFFYLSFTTDVSIFNNFSQGTLSSIEIKVGHFISFINNVEPLQLLFGHGAGSLFTSISKPFPVYDIELSPVEFIRKFGLLSYSAFSFFLFWLLRAISFHKISAHFSMAILLFTFNSFWNPLIFGILSVIIVSEVYLSRYPKYTI